MGWRTYLGTAAAVGAFFLVAASSAFAATPDCSTINSIPLTPAAGITCTVANESELSSILERVDSTYETYVIDVDAYPPQNPAPALPSTTTIEFSNGIQLTADLPFVNGPVVINGQGNALSSVESGGVPQYRGLLLYNSEWEGPDCGNASDGALCQYAPDSYVPVTVENLTIADTAARGGAGGGGAGGGAGFGGAVFASIGVALTLSGDSFSNNSAIGGGGGAYTDPTFATGGGGGGGMGGAGANGSANGNAGGGGGLGADASGGDGSGTSAGNPGIGYGLQVGGWGNDATTNGATGSNAGGAAGGGGGGGGSAGTGAGGGGLNINDELPYDTDSYGASGGLYGIGGGGGGGGPGAIGDAFGGLGGGQGFPNDVPNGGATDGFGGGSAAPTSGGGGANFLTASTLAGFGAGNGVNNGTGGTTDNATVWLGGGGAAMGGAVFVQMGATVAVDGTVSEAGAAAAGGNGACSAGTCGGNGSAYGSAIFLQGDGGNIENGVSAGSPSGSSLTFSPAAGQTQTFADSIDDQLSETYVPAGEEEEESNWSFTLNGAGTLELGGNTSIGGGTLNSGTLLIPTAASFHGNVTINSGATMILAGSTSGNVTLNAGGLLCAAQTPSGFTNNGGTVAPLSSCSTPPTAAINSPAGGGTYSVGQSVSTTFQCSAGLSATLSSCKDSNGASGAGGSGQGTLNTSAPGVYTYTVTATDSVGKTATSSITYAVTSPCKTTISFGLVQLTASCLQPAASGSSYSTPGPLTMNGLSLPALPGGALYVATEPTTANPGGQLAIQAPAVTVSLPINIGGSDGVTFDVGAFTWNLPAAPSGGIGYATVQSLSLAPKQLLKGMQLGGSATMDIGKDQNGVYYTSFVLTVDLPTMFKSGPTGNSAGLTGTASVRVDASGVQFNGMKIQVSNAYVGTLQVKSACFAYLPDGDTGVSGCPQPAVPATPLGSLSCTAAGGDSWQGSADIVLPTSGAPELSLYGNVSGGSLEELGASASNLKIALADDVFLNSVGLTMCLPNSTEPFSIQGTIQLGAIQQGTSGYLVNVNGSLEYKDAWEGQPWTLSAAGEVTVSGVDLGSGYVSFYGDQYLYFEVEANINLASIVSVGGTVEGWLETQSPNQFNVQGQVSLTLSGIGSLNGSAAVSSKGVSGCASVGGISYWEPEKDSDWEWYYPWRIHWVEETVNWSAGFGYYWGASSPSVWATSCDIGDYELAAPAGVEASAGANSAAANTTGFKVENAGLPMAVKINGAGGAPHVKITSPSGRVIAPPAGTKIGEKIPGVGMLLENKPGHATMLLLTSPAKGGWHVTALPGSVRITSIQTAKVVPPPEVVGAAKSLAGGKIGLGVGYALAAGEKMTLFVAGPRHSQQVIGVAKGVRCPGAHHSGPASQLCEHIKFTPVYGPSGQRTIYGAVTNHKGLSVATVKIATIKLRFRKPAATKPALVRKGTSVQIDWAPVLDASKYAVSVVYGDGRKLAYPTRKLTLTLTKLAKTDSVKATVYPIMPDGVIGKSATVTLKSGATRAGSKPKKAKPKKAKPKKAKPKPKHG